MAKVLTDTVAVCSPAGEPEAKKLHAPVLNLNGTSKGALVSELEAAYVALLDAEKALGEITVHGRDFQTVDTQDYNAYRLEHVDRLSLLKNVREQIVAVFNAVHVQG